MINFLTTAFCTGAPLPCGRRSSSSSIAWRQTPRCGSLEESKKRAKSAYDNIPDVNQLYLRERDRLKREGRIGENEESESPGSILRPEGVLSPRQRRVRPRPRPGTSEALRDASGSEELVDPLAAAEAEEAQLLAQQRGNEAYAALRGKLLSDTAFTAALAVCGGWAFGDTTTAASIALGSVGSLAYVFLLGRGVDRIGKSADVLGPARAAVLALLVAFSAKHRDVLQVLPVVLGFLTYKLATLFPLLTGEAFDELENSGKL